ncbi:hypothetical protein FRC07_014979, partial [Ceratobasidium sp. 392]
MSVATGSREARVHTQPSNRANAALAKGKSKALDERRVVYKPVLENPYQVKWPSTPLNIQNSILACLADLLPDVAEYHLARQTASRKRKTEASFAKRQMKAQTSQSSQTPVPSSKNSKKRARDDDDTSEVKRTKLSHDSTPKDTPRANLPATAKKKNLGSGVDKSGNSSSSSKSAKQSAQSQAGARTDQTNTRPKSPLETISEASPASTAIPVPPLLKHCTFGINEVTKRLEALAKPTLTAEACPTSRPRLRAVLVCRSDVDPPLLIAHLPILVATCNSSLSTDSGDDKFVKLVTLPMGAEHSLAEITGLRRVAVMALDAETPGLERLELLLSSLPALRETWLAAPSNSAQEPKVLIPTHVKQLKTTAPKDMKAAKEKRKRELGEARERAKEDERLQKKRRKLGPKDETDATTTENLEVLPVDDELSNSSEGDINQLTINEHYAKAFEYRKEREELAKLKEKYGSDFEEEGDEEDSESDESEDEYGEELTPAVDAALLRTLAKIRRKDPEIYDSNVGIFSEEAKKTRGKAPVLSRSTKDKSKPLTIKQQNLATLLESSSRPTSPSPAPLTHAQEQEALRDETISAFHNAIKESDDEDALLTLREGVQDEAEIKQEEYKDFLQREVGEDLSGLMWVEKGGVKVEGEGDNAQDGLSMVNGANESEGKKKGRRKERKEEMDQEFLMNYILNRGWIDKSEKRLPTYREVVGPEPKLEAKLDATQTVEAGEEDNGLDEDEFDEIADRFESTHNFRFEEPDAHIIATHPRSVPTVRRADTSRKDAREKKKERKAEKMLAKHEEVKRLKALKLREVREKLEQVRTEGGLGKPKAGGSKGKQKVEDEDEDAEDEDWGALGELDFDGDWDPEKHDEQMRLLYAEEGEYEDDGEKPNWDNEIDISDL